MDAVWSQANATRVTYTSLASTPMSPELSYRQGVSEVARVSISQQSSIDKLKVRFKVVSTASTTTGPVARLQIT
jgi:hypothetical protein